MAPRPERPGRRAVILLVLLGLGLRLLFAAALSDAPAFRVPILDAAAYDRWARAIASGDLWPREPFHLAPLYPYLCGLVYALAPDGPLAVVVLQHLAGTALALAAGILAAGLGGAVAGVAATFLVATYGSLLLHENLLLPEVLGAVLLWSGTAILLGAMRGPELPPRAAFKSGLGFGLAALVRPTTLLPAAVLAVWIAIRAPGGRESRRRTAVLFIAAVLLAVLPVTLINRLAGGEWVLVTASGGFNFYVGNHADADGGYVQPAGVAFTPGDAGDPTGRSLAEQAMGRPLRTREVSDYWLGRALDFIREEPGRALALYGRKISLFWSRAEIPQIVDLPAVREEVPLLRRLPLSGPWLLMPLALLGLVIAFPGRREGEVLRVVLITFTLATALFFITERYRIQAVPLLAVVAGGGAARVLTMIRSGRRVQLLLAVGALVLAVMAVDPRWLGLGGRLGHPWVPPMNRALGLIRTGADSSVIAQSFADAVAQGPEASRVYVNRGEWLRQRGDLAGARQDLMRAVALDPGDPLAWTALGGLEAAAGRNAAAEANYARALAIEPGHAPAALGLGQVLLTMRRPEEALAPLRLALAGPDSAAAHDALGVALLMTGARDEGLAHIERALAIDPGRATFHLHLGLALAEGGRLAAAEAAIGASLALDPGHRAARLSAILLARDRGDFTGARAHLDTLLAWNPEDQEALRLKAELGAAGETPEPRMR